MCYTILGRRWRRKMILYCTGVLTFLTMWTFLTLLILAAQDQLNIADNKAKRTNVEDDSYMGRGIQVVVGHYSGKLPDERKPNLTKEQMNSNGYRPLPDFGEMGRPVKLSQEDEQLSDELWTINQFNLVASDRISLNRSLPDVRKRACREQTYPSDLPDTSVIIVFHNEAYSTLLRTVTSVINRSPAHLLREIILVDDASEREFLGTPLEDYISSLNTTIKIIRSKLRTGLIRARLMGAAEAKGGVLTFLDSHCECTHGWLEPLLLRIKEDRTRAVCPVIDVINDRTFAYQKGIELFRGGFNWNLQFRWYSVPSAIMATRAKEPASPISSPTMAGGLFSIQRDYFYEVGSYDSQMNIWGGENLEMSFRIWQCGGSIEIHPCSHVGHIFRKASPHDFPEGKSSGSILNSNLLRVAEVWMDKWKHLFYKTAPQAADLAQDVDVSDRMEIRNNLQCNDFQWYLNNVWPQHFLPIPGQFFGRIRNYDTHGCIVSTPGEPGKRKHSLKMRPCTLGFDMWQLWMFTPDGSLKGDENQCLTATQISQQWIVQLKECGGYDKEKWVYQKAKQSLMHKKSGLCLDRPLKEEKSDEVRTPTLQKCRRNDNQRWTFLEVDWITPRNQTALRYNTTTEKEMR